jgi:hypothetical protein
MLHLIVMFYFVKNKMKPAYLFWGGHWDLKSGPLIARQAVLPLQLLHYSPHSFLKPAFLGQNSYLENSDSTQKFFTKLLSRTLFLTS